jgi:type I restriction enzyme S subunit
LALARIRKFSIPLPPSDIEQSAIATALGDMDALLAAQDALIAKKRAVKQGAMQELLTGKRRLPGFSGEWEVERLGQLGQTYGGLVGKSKKDFGQGDAQYVPFVNVMANIVIDVHAFDKVEVSPSESQNCVLNRDLLFNGSSETPEEVAMCSLVADDVDNLYLNSFCFGFRLKDNVRFNGMFLAYYMRSQVGRDLIKSLAQGSTRYNLSKTAFLDGELRLPSTDEQAAITAVLSDMDTELSTLEAQRAKTVQLKQGMMQTLLTGRIRLG